MGWCKFKGTKLCERWVNLVTYTWLFYCSNKVDDFCSFEITNKSGLIEKHFKINFLSLAFNCYCEVLSSQNTHKTRAKNFFQYFFKFFFTMIVQVCSGPLCSLGVRDEKISCLAALTFNHLTLVSVRFAWHDPENDTKVSICMCFINQNRWALLANHAFCAYCNDWYCSENKSRC